MDRPRSPGLAVMDLRQGCVCWPLGSSAATDYDLSGGPTFRLGARIRNKTRPRHGAAWRCLLAGCGCMAASTAGCWVVRSGICSALHAERPPLLAYSRDPLQLRAAATSLAAGWQTPHTGTPWRVVDTKKAAARHLAGRQAGRHSAARRAEIHCPPLCGGGGAQLSLLPYFAMHCCAARFFTLHVFFLFSTLVRSFYISQLQRLDRPTVHTSRHRIETNTTRLDFVFIAF